MRGFYVQANNVLIITNPDVAAKYKDAFDVAFSNAKDFKNNPISKNWFSFPGKAKPFYEFCFSPHKDSSISLDLVEKAIDETKRSVLFSIMTVEGGGDVFVKLKALGQKNDILSLGTIQSKGGLKAFKQNDDNQDVAAFSYLSKNTPEPFKNEISGGAGMVIHHKFLVCDFNGKKPVVFCGSSNLSSGGEVQNGDNLIAIRDGYAATCYAIEAIRLYDHYRFRTKHSTSTSKKPLALASDSSWKDDYYNPDDIKSLRREQMADPWPLQ